MAHCYMQASAPQQVKPEYIPNPEVIQMNDAFEYALSSAPHVLYARYKQYGQVSDRILICENRS